MVKMTLANKITAVRFVIIPFFVAAVLFYSKSITDGDEQIGYRIAALSLFALAAISDAFDGWVARKFNQQSPLGEFLDPLADKMLLLFTLASLGITHWHVTLPLWFGLLIIVRDANIMFGWLYLNKRNGAVKTAPFMTSKICTVLQLACVCWVLLDFWSKETPFALTILIYITATLTVVTWIQYLCEGMRQVRECGPTVTAENRS